MPEYTTRYKHFQLLSTNKIDQLSVLPDYTIRNIQQFYIICLINIIRPV